MRAIVSVIGKDAVGIIAMVSDILKKHGVNIMDITQSVLQEMFVMVMLADISGCNVDFTVLQKELEESGDSMGLKIHVMHEDIFNSMHRI